RVHRVEGRRRVCAGGAQVGLTASRMAPAAGSIPRANPAPASTAIRGAARGTDDRDPARSCSTPVARGVRENPDSAIGSRSTLRARRARGRAKRAGSGGPRRYRPGTWVTGQTGQMGYTAWRGGGHAVEGGLPD